MRLEAEQRIEGLSSNTQQICFSVMHNQSVKDKLQHKRQVITTRCTTSHEIDQSLAWSSQATRCHAH